MGITDSFRSGAWTQLRQTWRGQGDHSHSSNALLFQSSDILLHFQMQAAQSSMMLKTTPNLAESSLVKLKAFDILCRAA